MEAYVKSIILNAVLLFHSISFAQNNFIFNQYSASCNFSVFNNNANAPVVPGFGFEATRVMEISPRFDWTIGIGYNQTFQQTNFSDYTGTAVVFQPHIQRVDIGALGIPLSVRVYFDQQKAWFVEPGVYAAFTLYGKVHGSQFEEGEEHRFTRTSTSQLSPFDAGFLLGLGYRHKGEKIGWFIKPEMYFGMNNMWSDDGNSNQPVVRNSCVRLNVGVLF